MEHLFNAVNGMFASVVPVADFLWDFPTNYEWYASIPILGQFSLAIILLLGAGVYFTCRTGLVQLRHFKTGVRILTKREKAKVGTSPLAAFLLSMAVRVGAGNIVGVTGAVTIGGPGAIFWMWLSAFLGMATSFSESTLAQMYKEKKGDEYVGGLTFYIRKVWGDLKWVGIVMCVLYLGYNMLSIPVHTFHVFTAASSIIDTATGTVSDTQSMIYYVIAIAIVVSLVLICFGGIHRVTRLTDKVVPVMAIVYTLLVVVLVVLNITKVPTFFSAVFVGAFKPQAIFGGAFGVAVAQGIKRGLLSNEAGMGTVTQASCTAEGDHPCEQGFVQSIGVFVDTIVICSFTGFIVTMGQLWANPAVDWDGIKGNKIGVFLQSIGELVPGHAADKAVIIFAAIAFGLFAFTTLLGDIIFAEIAANRISKSKSFINAIRVLGALVFVPIGCISVLSGLGLDNLWYVSDLINVVLVFINVPTLIVASKLVLTLLRDYEAHKGERFVASRIGMKSDVWCDPDEIEEK